MFFLVIKKYFIEKYLIINEIKTFLKNFVKIFARIKNLSYICDMNFG